MKDYTCFYKVSGYKGSNKGYVMKSYVKLIKIWKLGVALRLFHSTILENRHLKQVTSKAMLSYNTWSYILISIKVPPNKRYEPSKWRYGCRQNFQVTFRPYKDGMRSKTFFDGHIFHHPANATHFSWSKCHIFKVSYWIENRPKKCRLKIL